MATYQVKFILNDLAPVTVERKYLEEATFLFNSWCRRLLVEATECELKGSIFMLEGTAVLKSIRIDSIPVVVNGNE